MNQKQRKIQANVFFGFYDNAVVPRELRNSYCNDISRSRSINQNIYLEYKLGFVHLKNLNYLNSKLFKLILFNLKN